jgi:hypothetical protein
VLPTESVAVAANSKFVADAVAISIAVQSLDAMTYDHVVPDTVALFVNPANSSETVAPASTVPTTVTPASFSARVTLSFPATAVSETLGGVVSILQVLLAVATEVLPAASVAVAVIA